MTVRLGTRYRGSRDRAAAPTLILDEHIAELTLDLFGPNPRDHVDHAAGRAGHHEPDGLVGKFRLRECGPR